MPAWLWGPVHRAQSSLPPELCVAAELHWLLRTLTSSLRAASARLPKHPRMIYPPTARAVAILRHHHAGARHAPPARPIDETGACLHRSLALRNHHAAHPQAAVCAWQETIGRCAGSCSLWLLSGSTRQQRGGEEKLAPPAMPMPRCAPRPGKARARGPDGGGSSSLMTTAAWPVRPDTLPSRGAFGAPLGKLTD